MPALARSGATNVSIACPKRRRTKTPRRHQAGIGQHAQSPPVVLVEVGVVESGLLEGLVNALVAARSVTARLVRAGLLAVGLPAVGLPAVGLPAAALYEAGLVVAGGGGAGVRNVIEVGRLATCAGGRLAEDDSDHAVTTACPTHCATVTIDLHDASVLASNLSQP